MKKILPRYAYIPLFITVALNMFTFFGTRVMFPNRSYYDFTLALDNALPLVPGWILVYVGAYVSWVVGYVLIARESKAVCYRILSAEQMAKLVILALFIFLPTHMSRPTVETTGLFTWGLNLIYSLDPPDNLFPSIHCLENWMIFRAMFRCKSVSTPVRILFGIFALGVFTSVLLVKQHVVLDVVSAVALVEIALFAGDRLRTGGWLERVNRRLGMAD